VAVPTYHCYFLNSAGHFVGFKAIAAASDADVPAAANILLAASEYPAIEVWDLGRRVYRAERNGTAPER
jgi:hypothetical protein